VNYLKKKISVAGVCKAVARADIVLDVMLER
jgi:hypothetical protein